MNSQHLLRSLVEVNSGSTNILGVSKVQDMIEGELKSLGFQTRRLRNPKNSSLSADFLIGELDGPQPKAVTLVCHADTVFEANSGFSGFEISEDRLTARGPGVIDDKGGIVVALSALEKFLRTARGRLKLRFVCSPCEEIGSPGFQGLFSEIAQSSSMILGFEPSLEDGSIVDRRQGNLWLQLDVEGTESHAGRAPELGANAALEICQKLLKIQKLENMSKHEITVNIGAIEAGHGKFNIVCGNATAKIDIRVPSSEAHDLVLRKIKALVKITHVRARKTKTPTRTTLKIVDDCPPLAKSSKISAHLARYLALISTLEGQKIVSKKSHGSSDCNYMSSCPLILDGLGPVGKGLHTLQETIWLSSLETRSDAVGRFLSTLEVQLEKS